MQGKILYYRIKPKKSVELWYLYIFNFDLIYVVQW